MKQTVRFGLAGKGSKGRQLLEWRTIPGVGSASIDAAVDPNKLIQSVVV
jgi:hypothetical protein